MTESPGVVDGSACRILKDAVSSPDGRLELVKERRSQFERFQDQFYWLLGIEDYPTEDLIAGVLDRTSLAIPKAVAKSLKLALSPKDANAPNRAWASIENRLEIDLYDIHLRPMRDITRVIFDVYHKLSKPQPVEVIRKFSREKAEEDFLRLGEEFQKLFNSDGLFLSLEDYGALGVAEEPQLFSDEQISITERIQRFELYRDELKRDVGQLKSKFIFAIEEAYWQRGDEERGDHKTCLDLLRHIITRAEDQNVGGDLVKGLEKLGERYLSIGKVSQAEESFSKALTEGRKFGNDNGVAYLLSKLVNSRIINQDSDLSTADGELAEAEEIWLRYGHRTSLLRTIAVKVRLHIAQEEYEHAEAEIDKGVNLYDEGFHPRGLQQFLDRCSKYLLDCPDEEMNSKGFELLEQAIALAKKYGEFGNLLESLNTKGRYAEGLALVEARSELDHYSNLKEDLDRVIDQFAKTNQDGTKEIEEFVRKLMGANYREGLRRASYLIPIEQVEGMGPEYFDSFEGEFGRYKSLELQTMALVKERHFDRALELLDESEKLATKFDSAFLRTKILETRYQCVRLDDTRKSPKPSKKEVIREQRSLIVKLIQQWTILDSHVGTMRWKQNLARWHWRRSMRSKEDIDPKTIELMEEIADFYRDRDARRYAFVRFDLIKWRQQDESVDSIAEYEALTKDPALPSDPGIMLELYRNVAENLHREGRLNSAIKILSKANDLAMESHQPRSKTSFRDVLYLAMEVRWHIENDDDDTAEAKLNYFKKIGEIDWGYYTSSETLALRALIERARGNHEDAKDLLRKRINYETNGGAPVSTFFNVSGLTARSVSLSFLRLWEIHIELDEPIEAEKVMNEKIYFDASAGFAAYVNAGIRDQTGAIRERSGTKAAKEFLIRLRDDDRIPQTSPSWILSELHIELKEWDDAEKVLKEHLILLSDLEDWHILNQTLKRLIDCCQENNGTEHTIEVLRELADHSDYNIASSSLFALIKFHREREEFPKVKELLGLKIEFEIENKNLVLASMNFRSLANLHIKLGEDEDAIEALKEECKILEEFRFVNGALIRIGNIHRKRGEFDELKDTLLKRIRGAEKAQSHRSYWIAYDYLIDLHIELEELEDAKRVLREAIAIREAKPIEGRSPKGTSHHLRILYEVHIKLGEWDDAVKVTKQRINLNLEFGDNRSAWFASTALFNDAIEHERFAVAQEAMQARIPIQFPREDPDEEEIKSAIEEFVGLDADQLDSKIQELMLEIPKQINKRDEWNSKVRKYLDERNEFNRQVKELIKEVQAQKAIRNKANQKVKELKDVRTERSTHLKEAREALRAKLEEQQEGPEEQARRRRGPSASKIKADMERLEKKWELGGFPGEQKEREYHKKMKKLSKALKEATKSRADGTIPDLKNTVKDAERLQEDAHKTVEKEVKKAQDRHELMVELSEEVDRLREKANAAHMNLMKSKSLSDSSHHQSISLKYRIEGAIRLKMGVFE